jgi:pSer/pThr/pTyr-binding forkhead associated (FHA) protein
MKSANGTFLNGCRLEEVAELRNKDHIRIGHFAFEVQILAALAADTHESHTALKAWLLEESASTRKPISQWGRTEVDIDLDRNVSPKA